VTVVYPFSKHFSQLDPELYIKDILMKQLQVRQLVIGYDHKFGMNRSGDINTLKKYAPANGFTVEEISARDIDHIAISSSKIRRALEEGHIQLASEFLGHAFSLNAKVVKGKQLGRTIGYPTANLKPEGDEKLIPATGVYFVQLFVDNMPYYGMMNIGTNPTTDSDNLIKIEVNIFEFNADIYGKTVRLNFLKRLRDEKKFGNLNELTDALHQDKQACLQLIAERNNSLTKA